MVMERPVAKPVLNVMKACAMPASSGKMAAISKPSTRTRGGESEHAVMSP